MDSTDKTRLLFVHSTGPTHVHRRNKKTRTDMRRHVMRDIGESRRVVKQNPTFDHLVPLTRPFWDQDPLTMLDQHWPMDVFSAYGLALLGTRTKEPSHSGTKPHRVGSFWFPFAFAASGFLRHFGPLYTSPTLLRAVYHQSSNRAKIVALERSMGTISCIEESIASTNAEFATRDDVIRAVLALICFNLLNLDYDQARTHSKGLSSVIAARGGTGALQRDKDLVLMVFWVDVTMSLLFDTKPNYPVPWNHMPSDTQVRFSTYPPSQLPRLVGELAVAPILSCMNGLTLVAKDIESRWVEKGDAIWNDEMYLGLRLNPLAHQLLSTPTQKSQETSLSGNVTEMIRLGALLWIVWVKQRSRSFPGSPMKYLSKLLRLLCIDSSFDGGSISGVSHEIPSCKLWLVAICAITSLSGSPERAASVELMADTARRLAIKDWPDAKTHVRQLPWLSAFDKSYADIWSQFR